MDPSDRVNKHYNSIQSFLESVRRGELSDDRNVTSNSTPRENVALSSGTQHKIWALEEQTLREHSSKLYYPAHSRPLNWPAPPPVNTLPTPDVQNPSHLIENQTLKRLFAEWKAPAMKVPKKGVDIPVEQKPPLVQNPPTDLRSKTLREILGTVIDPYNLKSVFDATQSQVRPPPGFQQLPAPIPPNNLASLTTSEGGLSSFDSNPGTSNAQLPIHNVIRNWFSPHSKDRPGTSEVTQSSILNSQIHNNQDSKQSKRVDTSEDVAIDESECNSSCYSEAGYLRKESNRQHSKQYQDSSSQNSESAQKKSRRRRKKESLKKRTKDEENKFTSNDDENYKNTVKKNEAPSSASVVKSSGTYRHPPSSEGVFTKKEAVESSRLKLLDGLKSGPPGILPPRSGALFSLRDVERAPIHNLLEELSLNKEDVEKRRSQRKKRNRKRNDIAEHNTLEVNDRADKLTTDTNKPTFGSFQNAEKVVPALYPFEGSFSSPKVEHTSPVNASDEPEGSRKSRWPKERKRGKKKEPKETTASNDKADDQTSTTKYQNEERTPTKPKKQNKKEGSSSGFQNHLDLEAVQKGLANKTLIKGELRINVKNFKECYISDPNEGKDILIEGIADRNRALEGDIVVVQLNDLAKSGEEGSSAKKLQKTGKVVHILEKVHSRECIGHLTKISDGDNAIFCPRDSRIPRFHVPSPTIPVSILQNPEAYKDVLFRAKIIEWNSTKFAVGLLVEHLGQKGELETETLAILRELNLNPDPVSQELSNDLDLSPPTEEEIDKRLDLRKECIFTIDPATARDLDDAVSIKKIGENRYKVGVHISDLTHFLKLGSRLDEVVAERATTIYMVDKAIHMLPIELCLQCSLLPGQDKRAVSVIWEMDGEGNILQEEFARTAIHSCAKLSYEQAQDVIDGKDLNLLTIHNGYSQEDIKRSVLQLYSLSIKMRERRFENGALRIDQPKANFRVNESSMPVSLQLEELKDSNRLIEEFMLQANQSVAAFIKLHHPKIALLRRHAPPKVAMMNKLIETLSTIGITVNSCSAKDIHACIVENSQGLRNRHVVLSALFSKPMTRAEYFCYDPESHHYALSIDIYTHFTSPIRRYADVVVHRLLCAILGFHDVPKWDTDDVRKFCQTSNRKKYAAKRAGEQSCELFTSLYIRQLGPFEVEGIVHNVVSHALDIVVMSLAITTRVYLENLPAKLIFEDKSLDSSLTVIWNDAPNRPVVYSIFSTVKVRLSVAEGSLNIFAELLP